MWADAPEGVWLLWITLTKTMAWTIDWYGVRAFSATLQEVAPMGIIE